tara:strand:+ start:119 stop:421 length:303 start_codon:yes stop_codon:yes gene_type:complete
MPRYKRVPGGEKNEKSGKIWSVDELSTVLRAFLSLPHGGVGVHESHPIVHKVSQELGRTVRSVEAQMHMFKSIRKAGNHGWGHMSKNCRIVWKEYLDTID